MPDDKRTTEKNAEVGAQLVEKMKAEQDRGDTPIIISGGNSPGKIFIFTDSPIETIGTNIYMMEGAIGRVKVLGEDVDEDHEIPTKACTITLKTE